MKKHLYEIKRLEIPAYLKWWFIKYRNAGTLSEVLENLTSPITLTNSLKRKFKIFKIEGNSVQDGEPSPEMQVPIQNVTGNVEVKVNSQNICTNVEVDQGKNNIIFYADVKLIKQTFNIAFTTNTALQGNSLYCSVDGLNLGLIKAITATANSKVNESITLSNEIYEKIQNATSLNFRIYKTNAGFVLPNDAQISNEDITSYVPHEEQTVTFPLEEGQVLHEGDTIEDKIVQRRKTTTLDGTEEWVLTNAEVGQFRLAINDMTKNPILCNYFGYKLTYSANGKPYLRPAEGAIFAEIGTEMLDEITVNAWKAWLAEKYANGTPLTIEYELAEPIETEFTSSQRTAKAQIDRLHSYKGTTYISSSNVPSPLFTIQYVKEET